MSFREKTNWIALVTSLSVWTFYFARVFITRPEGAEAFWLFAACLGVAIVIQIAMLIGVAVREPRALDALEDERDNLIELKGFRLGYFALTGLVLAAAALVLLDVSAMVMANALVLAIVLAETAKLILELSSYRRGAA